MSTTIRKGPDGELLFTEETRGEQHSVEVGFDSKGNAYCKSLKLYFGPDGDAFALEVLGRKMVEGALNALKRGTLFHEIDARPKAEVAS